MKLIFADNQTMILIHNINHYLFITTDDIVRSGKVSIFDPGNKLLAEHFVENSNFEKIKLPENNDNFNIRVEYDKNKYFRKIHIH